MLRDCHDANYGSTGVVPTPVPIFPWSDDPQPAIPVGSDAAQPAGDQRDLCCICSYLAECMYRGAANRSKLQCELFDVDVNALNAREDPRGPSELGKVAIPNLKGGLCCNCESRRHCAIRASEGNVWHCEEYC
jgi:hypothetical protein